MNYKQLFPVVLSMGLASAAYILTASEQKTVADAISDAGIPETVFLRFADEQEAIAVLKSAGLYVESDAGESGFVLSGPVHALDVVGIIRRPVVVTSPDDVEIPDGIAEPGFHVNYLGMIPLPSDVLAHQIFPTTPYRDFAR